jgi:uncharacterized HAD superfamily protein
VAAKTPKPARLLIGIDFDDVIYPYHDYLKRKVKARYGVDLSQRRVTTFLYNHLPELAAQGATREEVWRLVEETWMDAMDHAEAVLADERIPKIISQMRRNHKVVVVTARADKSRDLVHRFLEKHKIEVDAVHTGRFEKTGFDVLIDDFPKHAVENARHGGWGLLFTIDENSTFDESREPRVIRVHSWSEVQEAVARIAGRVSDA